MNLEQLWKQTLSEMETQLSRANFATWLRNSQLIDKKDGVFYVSLPNNFAKEWVENKYQKNILGILRNLDGSARKLEFMVEKRFSEPQTKNAPAQNQPGLENSFDVEFKIDPETNLNPRYSFKSFMVGPSNE